MWKKIVIICVLLLFGLGLWTTAQTNPNEADFVGNITNDTPFIEFPLRLGRTGSTIKIDMRPLEGELGGNLDTLVYLVDSTGNIVANNDDRQSDDSSSLLVFSQATAGQYRIIATRYNLQAGDTAGQFRLNIGVEDPNTRTFSASKGAQLDTGFPIDYDVQPTADWTILAYYGGDNNLEQSILNDLKEFENAGGSDNLIEIVALVDRNPQFATTDGNWANTRLYHVKASKDPNGSFQIDSEIIHEFANLNTSNGEIFAQFLVWSIEKFPAKNYIVALASHGGGWQGIIEDEGIGTSTDDVSMMTISDVQQAIAIAKEAAGVEKFALLINDACLMSSTEYFSAIAPYFKMAIASPEIVVDPALDMTLFTKLLREEPTNPDFETISRALVNKYIDEDILARNTSDVVYLTSAVTNLDEFESVSIAVEKFATVVSENISARAPILGKARSNTYAYTKFMGFNEKVDLGNLMRQVISISQDIELVAAAQQVLEALDQVRIYGNAGERVKDITSFYNIYFPEEQANFSEKYFDQTPLKAWSRMLRDYFNSFTPQRWNESDTVLFHEPISPELKVVAQIDKPGSIIAPLYFGIEYTGQRITTGFMTIDYVQADGTSIRYLNEIQQEIQNDENNNEIRINSWSEGIGFDYVTWDATLPVLSDGFNHSNELISTADGFVYFLEGEYRENSDAPWNAVNVTFDAKGQVQSVLNRSSDNTGLAVVTIPVGAQFRTFRNIVTPDGRIDTEVGNTYIWQDYGLKWTREPALTGQYNVGLFLTAYGGATGYTFTTAQVNNTNINANLRGEINNYLGSIIPRQATWSTVAYVPETVTFDSNSPDGSAKLRYYFASILEGPNQLSDFSQRIIDDYALENASQFVAGDVNGITVLQFSYERTTDNGIVDGRMFVFADSPQYATGYAIEVLRGTTVYDVNTLYKELIENSLLDATVNTQQLWTRQVYETATLSNEYAIRTDWVQTSDVEGWQEWRPATDSQTFFATKAFALRSNVQGVNGLLSLVLTGRVTGNLQNMVVEANQDLSGANNIQWSTTIYTGVRDNVQVYGRLYATQVDDQVVVLWMETPQLDIPTTQSLFQSILEPIVNNFTVSKIAE